MIAKAPDRSKRGHNTYGLLRYLFGKGRSNEHTTPHLVAAWDPEWLEHGAFADVLERRGGLAKLARDIDAAMVGHEVHLETGHVYHVALSASPTDGVLGDDTWRELATEAVAHMGFGPDAEGVGGCRWVAVHHGLSAEGNDHVHLVVNLVRGNGAVANTYRDWPRWRVWCRQVEDRLGLTPTAPAGEGSQKAATRPELERAAAQGASTDREQLRRVVAEVAVEAMTEIDFVNLLRHRGVLVAPRVVDSKVVGYRVALAPRSEHSKPVWFAGSSLRRDLSLPRLRLRWETANLPAQFAAEIWRGEFDAGFTPETPRRVTWRQVRRDLERAQGALSHELEGADPVNWHRAAGFTAEVVAALAHVDPSSERLCLVTKQLTSAAQLPHGSPKLRELTGVALPLLAKAARLAAVSRDPAPAMLVALVVLVYAIAVTLEHHAERHGIRRAAQHQISAVVRELHGHPAVVECRERAADQARSRTSGQQPPVAITRSGQRLQRGPIRERPVRGNQFSSDWLRIVRR